MSVMSFWRVTLPNQEIANFGSIKVYKMMENTLGRAKGEKIHLNHQSSLEILKYWVHSPHKPTSQRISLGGFILSPSLLFFFSSDPGRKSSSRVPKLCVGGSLRAGIATKKTCEKNVKRRMCNGFQFLS